MERFRFQVPGLQETLRIVQVSDLHSVTRPGLAETILTLHPDAVVITGDLFDGVQSPEPGFDLVQTIRQQEIDVFYVTGNHEYYRSDLPALLERLKAQGVLILDDREVSWKGMLVAGIDEASSPDSVRFPSTAKFRLLLQHDPRKIRKLSRGQADLILSGHLHGGQIRILGIGLAGPGKSRNHRYSLFPRFTSGLYRYRGTDMIVSRGLGDNMAIPRIGNPWHLPVIELEPGDPDNSGSTDSH